jgi:hypothetical protein
MGSRRPIERRSVTVKRLRIALYLAVGLAVEALAGCDADSIAPTGRQAESSARTIAQNWIQPKHHIFRPVASKYVYVTDRTLGELLVYSARVPNPSPIRTVTSGLGVVEGVTTDTSGHVYVVNNPTSSGAQAPSVREYTRGATSLIRTFSAKLHHPIDVAIGRGGRVFVSDQNGAGSQIVEYGRTGGNPIASVTTPQAAHASPRGIAVDATGDVFVAINATPDVWPPYVLCEDINYVYELVGGLSGTAKEILPSEQNWGLALDGTTLYESDFCLPQIFKLNAPYSSGSGTGIATQMAGYIKISGDQIITVPNYNAGNGYVIEDDLTGVTPAITIAKGLSGPLGAAAGP